MSDVRFDIFPDFITPDEQQEFIEWFEDSLNNNVNLVNGMSSESDNVSYRKTTRRNQGTVNFPEVAKKVFQRIRDHYGFSHPPQWLSSTKEGMIAVCTFPGGDTYPHIDPGSAITFNIVIQQADSGGKLTLDDVERDTPELALHAYAPCRYKHKVSPTSGEKNRYIFIFRLEVPFLEWEPIDDDK